MSKSSTAARRLPNREAALASLYGEISAKHMFPFWATSTDVAHDEIKQLMGTQKAVAHRWSYKNDIEPILFRAAELVTMDDSERRSLILVNPGLSPRRATVSTMYTAYRLNDANEVMPPHRHSPNAIRFGLTGKGNFTGVGGEDITFGPGDMVLTPVDTWHNHGNVGSEPAINLSVLDLPLVETLNAVYFEHEYTEVVDGKPVQKKQQTASLLVAPVEAKGHSIIDGKRFDWEKFDNLAVPGGSWFEHINGDEKRPAILFVASDEPALKCFHLFKKWGRDAAGDIVKLV